MSAYVRRTFAEFISTNAAEINAELQQAYARDGFTSLYTKQTISWAECVPLLQGELAKVVSEYPRSANWSVLLEYPLYRLRKRIDVVLLCGSIIVVVELKQNATSFSSTDKRQVEEYALDLRDFHADSDQREIVPMLLCTGVDHAPLVLGQHQAVADVVELGKSDLARGVLNLMHDPKATPIDGSRWDGAAYRPVPGIVAAASLIFTGHDVRELKLKDADNLDIASNRLIGIIKDSRANRRKVLCFLTGVPGSGKTLAGLQVVHDAVATGADNEGDIVYLSGNTPLVIVLREALARDEYTRTLARNGMASIDTLRRKARTRIQHITDFLRQYLSAATSAAPHEHVIVFDEAQRAWDEAQGKAKFNRDRSEPQLILELMGRHSDWAVCICLIGGGQEINSGEKGVRGWGDALRSEAEGSSRWTVHAPADAISGGESTNLASLGELPAHVSLERDDKLQLSVPVRCYRSPRLTEWVSAVLAGSAERASQIIPHLTGYPILLTRELREATDWLETSSRGQRRYGLLASSGARRLRADGLGQLLSPADGINIAHWYLNERGDIRSSFALEVPANEYASQGLELDFGCLCWGGDLLWDAFSEAWVTRRLSGARWKQVRIANRKAFNINRYRVLLTRAREGLVIWVPRGADDDATRSPEALDNTAAFLVDCGVKPISSF